MFSDYTLAGYTFLGVGIELPPSILRFAFIWGRFVRSAFSNAEQSLFVMPSLSRRGYAIKLGLGTSKNFVALIWFRAKDDSTTQKNNERFTGNSFSQRQLVKKVKHYYPCQPFNSILHSNKSNTFV